jgi:hypothetical protein
LKELKESCENNREIPNIGNEELKCKLTLVINNGQSKGGGWEKEINVYCACGMCQALVRYSYMLSHLTAIVWSGV